MTLSSNPILQQFSPFEYAYENCFGQKEISVVLKKNLLFVEILNLQKKIMAPQFLNNATNNDVFSFDSPFIDCDYVALLCKMLL